MKIKEWHNGIFSDIKYTHYVLKMKFYFATDFKNESLPKGKAVLFRFFQQAKIPL
jgi:hypothetical protein